MCKQWHIKRETSHTKIHSRHHSRSTARREAATAGSKLLKTCRTMRAEGFISNYFLVSSHEKKPGSVSIPEKRKYDAINRQLRPVSQQITTPHSLGLSPTPGGECQGAGGGQRSWQQVRGTFSSRRRRLA